MPCDWLFLILTYTLEELIGRAEEEEDTGEQEEVLTGRAEEEDA